MEKRRITSKKEIVIVLMIFLLAIAGWLVYRNSQKPEEGAAVYGEIYHFDELVYRLPLSEPQVVTMPQNPEVILEVREDGTIGFTQSNCPDQLCVQMGFKQIPGDNAACLPNSVLLFVVSEEEETNRVDLVA